MKLRTLALIGLCLVLTACASIKTAEETHQMFNRLTTLVEEKKLGEALDLMKSTAHCENSALIGSKCGAWSLNYEIGGKPVQFRTIDQERAYSSGISYGQGDAGDEILKKAIRFMSMVNECGRISEEAGSTKCFSEKLTEGWQYKNPSKISNEMQRFKNFACGVELSANPRGAGMGQYSALEVFVFRSDFSKEWEPIKKIASSEMCQSHLGKRKGGS